MRLTEKCKIKLKFVNGIKDVKRSIYKDIFLGYSTGVLGNKYLTHKCYV